MLLVAAMRVLIEWVYPHTRSLLLAQLMHASSIASLVLFGAPQVSAGQEMLRYAVYAALFVDGCGSGGGCLRPEPGSISSAWPVVGRKPKLALAVRGRRGASAHLCLSNVNRC